MKIDHKNVDYSLVSKTEIEPESMEKSINISSKGIASGEDAFITDAASDKTRLTNAFGTLINPSGIHNTLATTGSIKAQNIVGQPFLNEKAVDSAVSQVQSGSDNNTGWFPGNIFQSTGGEKVTISTGEPQRAIRPAKDDDED